MRYLTTILFLIGWGQCLSQTNYDETLSVRLTEIKKQEFFVNNIVIHIDSVDYYDLNFPYWKVNDTYFQDDLVRYKYCLYRVLVDSSLGHRPDTSWTDWALSGGPHPYLFLRDTAKLSDLEMLMTDSHPYVRTYAFGALAARNSDKLFSLIISNLKDKTLMEIAGCAFSEGYPADMMIEYAIDKLGDKQKKN
jgi:hypothetical protein